MQLRTGREWFPEVDVSKGLAILMVVLYHAVKWGGGFEPSYKALTRALHVCVPLFFMLSAMVLVRRFLASDPPDWRAFARRRWRQVVVPFLIWTTVYVAILFRNPETRLTLGNLASWYLLGQASPHLWFTPVLIQFYLLLALLWPCLRRRRPNFLLTVVAITSVQAAYIWVSRQYIYAHYPGNTVFTLVSCLGLGLWLGLTYERSAQWWKIWRGPVLLIALTFGYLFTRPPWVLTYFHLYVGAASLATLFLVRDVLAHIRPGRVSAAARVCHWLSRLGEAAYGIYLVHPICLKVWFKLWPEGGPLLDHIGVWGGFLTVMALSWGLSWLVRKTPFNGWLFGGR